MANEIQCEQCRTWSNGDSDDSPCFYWCDVCGLELCQPCWNAHVHNGVMNNVDFARLASAARGRAEKAHKGPWHIHEGDLVDANHQDVFDDWEQAYGPNEDEVGPDTAFICAAQQDVMALTNAVSALLKQRDAARNGATMHADTAAELKSECDRLRNALQRIVKSEVFRSGDLDARSPWNIARAALSAGGSDTPLVVARPIRVTEIHHKDENPRNNAMENLELRCATCHGTKLNARSLPCPDCE